MKTRPNENKWAGRKDRGGLQTEIDNNQFWRMISSLSSGGEIHINNESEFVFIEN